MFIKDFDFKSIHAVRKQCWTYKTDGNTPIKKGKNLYPLEVVLNDDTFKGFFIEIVRREYDDPFFQLWNDLGNSCVKDNGIHPYAEIECLKEEMQGWQSYIGIEGFKRSLCEISEKHKWINNACIMALVDNGEMELAKYYQEYHDKLKTEREKADRQWHSEVEQREREREQKHEEEIVTQLNQAEQNIRERKDLKNEMIDGKSIVLCLMDKYGIKVPIKTQGWFNQKLAFVKWIDGEITYSYYRTKGTNGSQTAFKYLRELEYAINNQ